MFDYNQNNLTISGGLLKDFQKRYINVHPIHASIETLKSYDNNKPGVKKETQTTLSLATT